MRGEQLHLLSIFHYVLAGLRGLLSLLPVLHIAVGIGLSGALPLGGKGAPPPAAFGWMFICMGAVFVLTGVTYTVMLALAGRFIARARHWTYCVVMAAISCAFFPFGTVHDPCARQA